jgi:hypothetical protein
VPKTKCEKLRKTLTAEDTGELRWREQKTRSGSEFYFTGPAGLVRKTHDYITKWIAFG